MKWWKRRQPEDLVGWQVAELAARDAAERALLTPQSMEQGTSWAQPWRDHVQSGGWCAPSETIYGLLELPEVRVQRGGITFPRG